VLTLGETRIVGTVKVEFEEGRFFRADRTSWSNVHYYADGWEFTPDSTPIPTRDGAVIRMRGGTVWEFDAVDGSWYGVGDEIDRTPAYVQRLADSRGFDVLWEGDGDE
jgi:hypothetical protein